MHSISGGIQYWAYCYTDTPCRYCLFCSCSLGPTWRFWSLPTIVRGRKGRSILSLLDWQIQRRNSWIWIAWLQFLDDQSAVISKHEFQVFAVGPWQSCFIQTRRYVPDQIWNRRRRFHCTCPSHAEQDAKRALLRQLNTDAARSEVCSGLDTKMWLPCLLLNMFTTGWPISELLSNEV